MVVVNITAMATTSRLFCVTVIAIVFAKAESTIGQGERLSTEGKDSQRREKWCMAQRVYRIPEKGLATLTRSEHRGTEIINL